MFGYKNPWIDSSTSWEQEELNNKITKDNYYKRSKVTDKDTGKAKYHALNEILDPETGKYELSDYYGDVTPEGSYMMEPVYAEYQQGGQVKDKFGYGSYQKGGEVKSDKEYFKSHSNAWLRLTEMPGMFDKRRRSWKENTEEFMKNPDFVEFLKAEDYESKLAIVARNMHPMFKDSPPEELMHELRNYI